MRVSLGLVVITDLIVRSTALTVFYGDQGVYPLSLLYTGWRGEWAWSLHLLGGGPLPYLIGIFVIHGIAAFCMMIGYRTRTATFVTWFLMVSLHNANSSVLQGGDDIFRSLLFIGIFLPWGSVFSVDQAFRYRIDTAKRVVSGWTAAVLLQMAMLYFFAVLFKHAPDWATQGSAVYYALSINQMVTPIGVSLLQFPKLLQFLTFTIFGFQHVVPLLLFFPYRTNDVRSLTLIALVIMHISFSLCLQIGLFSWIMISGLVAFLPSEFWDGLSSLLQKKFGGIAVYYDGECGFCRNLAWVLYTFFALPNSRVLTAQTDASILADMRTYDSWVVVSPNQSRHIEFDAVIALVAASPIFFVFTPLLRIHRVSRIGRMLYRYIANRRPKVCIPEQVEQTQRLQKVRLYLTTIIAISYITYLILWNITMEPVLNPYIMMPSSWNVVAKIFRFDQNWSLFAPYPTREGGWYVMSGTLKDGRVIDIFRNGNPVSYTQPTDAASLYSNERWRKYMMNLGRKSVTKESFARILCTRWNSTHDSTLRVIHLEIILMSKPTPPPGQPFPIPKKVSIVTYECT